MEHISKTITQQQTTSTPIKTKTTENPSNLDRHSEQCKIPADCHPGLAGLPEHSEGMDPGSQSSMKHPEQQQHSGGLFHSKKFNFTEVIAFLQKFGKQTYGKHFKIYKEDHKLIFKLLSYFFQDKENVEKYNINLAKGILLTGPIGCGKTSLMSMLRFITPPTRQHIMLSTRKIKYEFIEDGYKVIQRYSSGSFKFTNDQWTPKTYCFDDLGIESEIKHYGNRCNIMAESYFQDTISSQLTIW